MFDPADWLLRSHSPLAQLVRFATVGTITSVAYVLVVAGLVGYISEPEAAALAYLVLLPVNYLGHRRATFRSCAPSRPELMRYVGMHGITLLACMAVMLGVTACLGASHWAGSAVIAILAPLLNFALMHLWVFRTAGTIPADPQTPPS